MPLTLTNRILPIIFFFTIASIACGQNTSSKKDLTQKKIEKKKVQSEEDNEVLEIDDIAVEESVFQEGDDVFEIFDVSQKALFPGGEDSLQRFIAAHITYPRIAIANNTQGNVNVVFIVDKEGRVKDVAILGKPKGDGLDDAAMSVIKLTSGMWKPAIQRDKPVNMRYRIPIAFRL